ncbi:CHAT domain-containing protein [Thermoleptolyngbya sichuanensis A183]|uniref:CHAT domain-containing protein n=1 Tax=Thermoleptolyngbya sichuanensis A183 TaxID=2737172 RepID=A0A6M8BF21_9CYAN|nr:CHAT domain-containing protein [Thermoleptolyngbya sichuanensis]QKD82850.1 CHAT domain-containing protein [Thermoleptolyngbya sichuanensis A183]
MTQEFHLSVTPVGNDEYLVRTERVAPGVPLAEEQLRWAVEEWLALARQLMDDPLLGLLRGHGFYRVGGFELPRRSEYENELPVSLTELGETLYHALFQGTLRNSWMIARGIAQHQGEMLRLRLGLKGSRLPRLPWEVMNGGDRDSLGNLRYPIATGTDVVFSRFQTGIQVMGGRSLRPLSPTQPVRILMVVATPTDQERLELMREAMHLQEELRRPAGPGLEGLGTHPQLELTVLEQPGREELTHALEQGHFHILHYAGHSNLGASGGNLYLVNSRTGLTETLSGDDLAGLLVNNDIRLVVFNSCRGAHTAVPAAGSSAEAQPAQDTRNLAEALVSRGIPAVLAMAEKIPDDVALTLTRLFYRNLRRGFPIDLSLSRARQGLISSYTSNQLYWALPVLYLHPAFDGYLVSGDSRSDPCGNRHHINPADRLQQFPPSYDLPLLAGEEPSLVLSPSRLLEPDLELDLETDEDFELISRAVLLDHDWASPGLEFDNPFHFDAPVATENPFDFDFASSGSLVEVQPTSSERVDEAAESRLAQWPIHHPGAGLFTLGRYDQEPSAPAEGLGTADQPAAAGQFAKQSLGESPVELPGGYLGRLLAQHANPSDHSTAPSSLSLSSTPAPQQTETANAANAADLLQQLTPRPVDLMNVATDATQDARPVDAPVSPAATYRWLASHAPATSPDSSEAAAPPQDSQLDSHQQTATPQDSHRAITPVDTIPTADRIPALRDSRAAHPARKPGRLQKQHILLPLAGAGAMAIALSSFHYTMGLLRREPSPADLLPPMDSAYTPGVPPMPVGTTETSQLAGAAILNLKRENLPEAEKAIAQLLDQNALLDAKVALDAVPSEWRNASYPELMFLMGRLGWQWQQQEGNIYSVDDVQRFWKLAAEGRPDAAAYWNALGFAHYAKGESVDAARVWCRAAALMLAQPIPDSVDAADDRAALNCPPPIQSVTNPEALTAYAGVALALQQAALDPRFSQGATELLKQSAAYYQMVMLSNPASFDQTALAKNWLWTPATLKDWAALGSRRP